MINKKIKIGVVGLGYLGEFHVKHLSTLDKVEFWESSMINTDVKYTNVKLMEYVNNTC